MAKTENMMARKDEITCALKELGLFLRQKRNIAKDAKSRRQRPRTPALGHYLGLKSGDGKATVVIVVGIVENPVMMTMGSRGLQGARHIMEVVITLLDDHYMVGNQGGKD